MAEDLTDYLAGREVTGFTPRPHYSRDGDFLTFFFADEDAVAERVDELLTVYLSAKTKKLVGVKIKGVRRILSTLGAFGGTALDPPQTLGVFFLGGMAVSREPQHKERYRELGEATKTIPFDAQELQLA